MPDAHPDSGGALGGGGGGVISALTPRVSSIFQNLNQSIYPLTPTWALLLSAIPGEGNCGDFTRGDLISSHPLPNFPNCLGVSPGRGVRRGYPRPGPDPPSGGGGARPA